MASIIQGYQYDIFIRYRQKDNKGDRWVREFADALKTELDSTFKEEISVYFDINPQDGLLETHDVDASLKDKLKCLVFKASDRPQVKYSGDAYNLFIEQRDHKTIEHVEEFKVMLMNRSNAVPGIMDVSKGGIYGLL
jgi:hypothetical protein